MPYALSIKQPWAALLAHGLKTIEIRRWPTSRRGRIWIHASRTPDERPEAWKDLPVEVQATARLRGGIIGSARLVDCRTYRDVDTFTRDRPLHWNDPGWFEPTGLHGFVFEEGHPCTFLRCAGWFGFFVCPEVPTVATPAAPVRVGAGDVPRLLVSVRDAGEARAALEGGADLVDVKEPSQGSLGRAGDAVVADIVRIVDRRCPVSAALGELTALAPVRVLPGVQFYKCGLAGVLTTPRTDWQRAWLDLGQQLAQQDRQPRLVVAAYAEGNAADAPAWQEVVDFACLQRGGVLLIDTCIKSPVAGGRRAMTLLDWISIHDLAEVVRRCRAARVQVALAGSLGEAEIRRLLPVRPTWFAVRGAACEGQDRNAVVSATRVRALAELVRSGPAGS